MRAEEAEVAAQQVPPQPAPANATLPDEPNPQPQEPANAVPPELEATGRPWDTVGVHSQDNEAPKSDWCYLLRRPRPMQVFSLRQNVDFHAFAHVLLF